VSSDAAFRRTVLTALAATTSPTPPPPPDRAALVQAAVAALEERAPLAISALELCRKVKGFGDFEPIDSTSCRPGRSVIVYCEMTGLRYAAEGDMYRSRLSSRIEVVASGGGEPVWKHDLGTAGELGRRRRRDFYVNYRVTLPEGLSPGSYELRLIQDDLVANRSASRSVPLVLAP
jgi:hypothetical protein